MRTRFDVYPSWTQYAADVIARFGEAYEDPLAALIQVKQQGTVQDYIDAFELALTQVSLIPEHSLSIFLAGLEHSIQMQVRMFNPTTISHAANLAKLYEASKPSIPKTHSRPAFVPTKPPYTPPKTPLLNHPSPPTPSQKPVLTKIPRTFNASEMADRRAKGLCMFCDELFTPGHHLKHKRSQLLVMELDEDEHELGDREPVEEVNSNIPMTEVPQLSLNAMTGLSNY